VVFHAFVPFAANGAQNLYLGNNPHNRDAGINRASDVDPQAAAKLFAIPDELGREHAFAAAAQNYIAQNPSAFVRASAKRFLRFWNVVPNAPQFSSAFYALISATSFGPVLLLAIVAAIRRRNEWRLLAPLYLSISCFTAVYIMTVASLRYRFPIEPLGTAIRRLCLGGMGWTCKASLEYESGQTGIRDQTALGPARAGRTVTGI